MFAQCLHSAYISDMGSAVRPSKPERTMSQQHTYAEIAADFALWNEFVNTDGAMTEDEFNAMTIEQKVALQVEAFGAEA